MPILYGFVTTLYGSVRSWLQAKHTRIHIVYKTDPYSVFFGSKWVDVTVILREKIMIYLFYYLLKTHQASHHVTGACHIMFFKACARSMLNLAP